MKPAGLFLKHGDKDMELDKSDLRRGMEFIKGIWQVDYVVNAFSNDLRHIPASEFKSSDGKDFTAITFEFSDDHSAILRNSADGKEVTGTWEQTGWSEYRYSLGGFFDIPEDSPFLKAAETLSVYDGYLVFSLGFLAIGMKKVI